MKTGNRPLSKNDVSETFLELLISEGAIQERIAQIAEQIDRHYLGKEVLLIMIMKGALCLAADLIRVIEVPTSIEFLRCSSYGEGGVSRGRLHISGLDHLDVSGKHVLVIDDIFDSGHTLAEVITRLQKMCPESLQTLVLLSKRAPSKIPFQPDYVLFEIEDRFVVGYGLDYKERFRGLPGVYALLLENLPAIP